MSAWVSTPPVMARSLYNGQSRPFLRLRDGTHPLAVGPVKPWPLIQARQIRPAAPVGARNWDPADRSFRKTTRGGVSRIGGQAGTQAPDPTRPSPQDRGSRAGSTIHILPADYGPLTIARMVQPGALISAGSGMPPRTTRGTPLSRAWSLATGDVPGRDGLGRPGRVQAQPPAWYAAVIGAALCPHRAGMRCARGRRTAVPPGRRRTCWRTRPWLSGGRRWRRAVAASAGAGARPGRRAGR
jgi:hypothetical protein